VVYGIYPLSPLDLTPRSLDQKPSVPFRVVYGIYPLSPLDLTPQSLDQKPSANTAVIVEEIQKVHELVKGRIVKTNA